MYLRDGRGRIWGHELACPLVRLVLPHQWEQLLGGPTLGLEIVVLYQLELEFRGGPECQRRHKKRVATDATACGKGWNGPTSLALALVYIMKLMEEPPPRM